MSPRCPQEPLLTVDAGNSRIKFGLFGWHETPQGWSPRCERFLAVGVQQPAPLDEIATWRAEGAVRTVFTGSNPPALQQLIGAWMLRGWSRPGIVRQRDRLPITLNVDYPEKVGLDRILNAIAVNVWRAPGQSAVIIDSGTATTVDVVNGAGEFIGGAILPGLELGARALHEYTALLPDAALRELPAPPPALGRNTIAAMRSGLYWGHVGAIRELVRQYGQSQHWQLRDDWPASLAQLDEAPSEAIATGTHQSVATAESRQTPYFVLTGGAAPQLGWSFPQIAQVASLAMHGLVLSVVERPECVE